MFFGGEDERSKKVGWFIIGYIVVTIIISISFLIMILKEYEKDTSGYNYTLIGGMIIIFGGFISTALIYNALIKQDRLGVTVLVNKKDRDEYKAFRDSKAKAETTDAPENADKDPSIKSYW